MGRLDGQCARHKRGAATAVLSIVTWDEDVALGGPGWSTSLGNR